MEYTTEQKSQLKTWAEERDLILSEISVNREKNEKLRKENKRLQIEEAELNSFYNIRENVGNLNMVEAKEIVYIDNNDNSVAIGK